MGSRSRRSLVLMPVLLLPPGYTTDSVALWRAALASGWDVQRLHGWQVPDGLAGKEVVVYGETFFCGFVADALNLALLEPPFEWLTSLPPEFLRREVRFTRLGEARHLSARMFFKPADDKCFRARVYNSGDELPDAEWLTAETPVLAAEPVEWELEFRCFVLEGTVVAHSPYLRYGELARADDDTWPVSQLETEDALAFAAKLLTDTRVQAPPACVIDVGRIAGRGWAVVEANPAWAAGIYGCDPAQVLRVLRRAAAPRALLQEDRRWVIRRIDD